ncbi:MAG: TldD/PmbA family protein [Planctomycetota bacterium]|jgi:predicted Zn-dependent protease
MQEYFSKVADFVNTQIRGGEVFTSQFNGEESDFVRFNGSEVRQAGSVTQREILVDLIQGQKHASGAVVLSGDFEIDKGRLEKLVKDLRERRSVLPDDPYLLYATDVNSTERVMENRLPDGAAAVANIRKGGKGRDLVGIYAAGGIHAGFANSFGQRNWYTNFSHNFDWSFYHSGDKAVKTGYAGFEWKPDEFDRKVRWASEQLDVLKHESRTIDPGKYRVYLAPAALDDLVGILGWGGFGLKSHRTKMTPLLKMTTGEVEMSPSVTLLENTEEGIAPNFQSAGFLKPDRVTLIEKGKYKDCLVSPRSAKEYKTATNGASTMESPESIDLSAGDVGQDEILKRLGTGIFINNVWYLNYSDRMNCRTTGMTRFATFWVENGKIAAPLNVMRFDETVFSLLGKNLAGLTSGREMILNPGTYGGRSTGSSRMPGALVNDFTLTL